MPRRLPFPLALALLLLLAACAVMPGMVEEREVYYFDANLGFAIERPADWLRQEEPLRPVVRWSAPAPAAAEASILSLPPQQARGGADRLEQDVLAAHPGFDLTSRREKKLPAAPARQLTGRTAERTFLLYLITSSRRAFVLEFSAPHADFDRLQPVFKEMAESFIIL